MGEGRSQVYAAYRNSSQQLSYNLMRPWTQMQLQCKAHSYGSTNRKLEPHPFPKEEPSLAILLPWCVSEGNIITTCSGSPSHISNHFIKAAICMECSPLLFRCKISIIKKKTKPKLILIHYIYIKNIKLYVLYVICITYFIVKIDVLLKESMPCNVKTFPSYFPSEDFEICWR